MPTKNVCCLVCARDLPNPAVCARDLLNPAIDEYEAFRSFLYNNNGNGRTIEYIKCLIMAKSAIEKRVRDLINSLKLGLDN